MVCSEHVIQKFGQCKTTLYHCSSFSFYKFPQLSSTKLVPSQRESLVDAIVVDELDLESAIRVEGQSAPREHQVDLELVGWGQDEIENRDTNILSKLRYSMKHTQAGRI